MKSKLVIGNWKMNLSFEEAEDLTTAIEESLEDLNLKTEVVLCPPFTYLELVTDHADEANFYAGAQNCCQFKNGAFTGEVSAEMLVSLGVEFCIVGHSERRKYFGETNAVVAEKVNRLMEEELIPVVCCGESLEERKNNSHFQVVEKQIKESLFHLNKEEMEHIVIAYEPIWAIGTGETATPAQAEEMHAFIRSLVEKKYGTETAYNTYIIYGGSCNAQNAMELFTQENVDGGLIGGASLRAGDFVEIVEAAETAISEN
ncbi:MAG: triose-phosphate isomerase [Bacteroidales bacterium]|nr:triose-phosphate isomerase [Bacteroidales bacterium]